MSTVESAVSTLVGVFSWGACGAFDTESLNLAGHFRDHFRVHSRAHFVGEFVGQISSFACSPGVPKQCSTDGVWRVLQVSVSRHGLLARFDLPGGT